MSLDEEDIPNGSLRHDTELMFSAPVRILKEWRLWAVGGKIVTYSLYKEGRRVVYREEIDEDALARHIWARHSPGSSDSAGRKLYRSTGIASRKANA